MPQLLTVASVAKRLAVSERTVARKVAQELHNTLACCGG